MATSHKVPSGYVLGSAGLEYFRHAPFYAALSNKCGRATGLIARRIGLPLEIADAHNMDQAALRAGWQEVKSGHIQPDDLLVWEYTYGSKNRQHVGFAGYRGGKLVVISNGVKRFDPSGVRVFRYPGHKATAYVGTGPQVKSSSGRIPTRWGNPRPAKRPPEPKPIVGTGVRKGLRRVVSGILRK